MSKTHIDDRLDFRLLRYFAVVAEELHFARAAARLGIAQPPLSQHIKRLEEMVGVELFHRTSRRVTLTEAGTTLLTAAQRAVREMERGVDDAQAAASGQTGALTIGYAHLPASFFLPALIRAFRKQHPQIRLTLHGIPTMTQLDWLHARTLDAAIASEIQPGPGLVIHRHWADPLIYVRPQVRSAAAEGLILFPRQQAPALYDRILSIAKEMEPGCEIGQEGDSWHSVASLVAAGLGFTIAPSTIRRYRIPGLTYQSLGRRPPTVSVALVTRAERLSVALQAFIDEACR